ncbi:ornithine cyclodeaminase [Falsiroseomonas bella]|uniref:Ornithine cyclodeaminase n=1 Tax=Falsiroseomonas bella TaxID=2184016 RepID=A0A317FKJ6_9PROT|nr:ornithine cyclodeaminase family protein [Falsiroseomonas bella]PWS38479.1 ornithine cyclodeaminase [Falsiroseomonas bella]
MLTFLDEARLRALLRYEALIPAIERALVAFSAGRVQQPPRHLLHLAPHGGHFAAMSAYGDALGLGVKLVAFHPGNAAQGLPTHHGLVVLLRPETGEPLAVMDARPITAMRTAAASALATRALARADARVLAILGTGAQARAHAEALRLVRDFREIRVWGRNPVRAQDLAKDIGAVAMPSAEAAVRGAQVVVTATAATEPVLRGAWLEPEAQVNAIGWSGAAGSEVDDAVLQGAFVIADSGEAVGREAGGTRPVEIGAELGEILAGTRRVPDGGRRVFRSVGLAVQDVAAAALVAETLRLQGG